MTQEIETYSEFDALDEKAMIDDLKGNVIQSYFYEFKQGGRQVVGISFAGVKHIANLMAGNGHPVSITEMEIEETEKTFRAKARAKDLSTGEERFGLAEQQKSFASGEANQFAYTLAGSKAERNALRKFIQESVIEEGYREWRGKQTQKTIQ